MSKDNGMTWIPDLGVGYCPQQPAAEFYGQSYWDEYVRRSSTPMGKKITQQRVELVDTYLPSTAPVLDIGIGCGHFIETRKGTTFGHDVNPVGVIWLHERGIFRDPRDGFSNMTFWDALEHIPDASRVLAACKGFAFVTLPIFRDEAHVRESRHFKPGEHLWYFTRSGLIRWFKGLGFQLKECNAMETVLGREDIETFVFKRESQSERLDA